MFLFVVIYNIIVFCGFVSSCYWGMGMVGIGCGFRGRGGGYLGFGFEVGIGFVVGFRFGGEGFRV